MKRSNEKKLGLGKITVQDLETSLSVRELKEIKGGNVNPNLVTVTPVYC